MLDLHDREWSEFPISAIFTINPGKRLTKSDMKVGKRPFIGATDSNNGITNYVSNSNASLDCNVLGVNYNGSVVETFFHPYECVFSDDVKRFKLKNWRGNKLVYLFLKTALVQQKSKYAYGYKFNEQRMNKQSITLPVDNNGKPDWTFMEEYIRERERICLEKYKTFAEENTRAATEVPALNEKEWYAFPFNKVFIKTQRGKRLKTADHHKGNVPYVSSTATNNGVDNFISNTQGVRKFEDCLTIANSGSVGKTFYHRYEFVASDHVTQLINPEFNQYIYLFLAPLVSRLEEKYSFNREINDTRITKEVLLLPVASDGEPDWTYMEQYAKTMMSRQVSAYLKHIEHRGKVITREAT